ncbi:MULTISPECIES: TIGR02680 family protein [unclassified Variovorax]|uniref:TIGR02680 family protein n=1 Tax=unclassified Variovorax TaxID=663243 RepID=UPI001BD5334A|nr:MULTISPECIES: TIGR02680 family protein [unclassified Variovorax]
MTDDIRPPLPQPGLPRWQPLRLGLTELFHYDSEEFWFRDGHLLLRGNNGTGKSKVLSLTLPFLFDAQLKPSRIEPDGDPGKKMAWNLLLGRHDRRMGYAWIEFGRVDADGTPRFLTLGCGLSAVAARTQVDSWFFLLEGSRIGQDLWLIGPTHVVLTRERLRDALAPLGGQLFPTATEYRRAVDERLFHLGPVRYAALMDTLIQLRQPQLSKKPDEANLSQALTEALPPLSTDLLADVADALSRLEEDRRELAEYEALERAVGQFSQRYRRYAATQTRRKARDLRSAQTGFDNASRELNDSRAALTQAEATETEAIAQLAVVDAALTTARLRQEALLNDPAMASAKQLDSAEREARRRQEDASKAAQARQEAEVRLAREQLATRQRSERTDQATEVLATRRQEAVEEAAAAGMSRALATSPLATAEAATLEPSAVQAAQDDLRRAVALRRQQTTFLLQHCDAVERAAETHARTQEQRDLCRDEADDAAARRAEADDAVATQAQALLDAWQDHLDSLRELQLPDAPVVLDRLAAWASAPQGQNPAHAALLSAQQASADSLARRQAELEAQRHRVEEEEQALLAERARLERGEDAQPPAPHWRAESLRLGRTGAPLWQLVDFRPGLADSQRAGLEAALQAAGLLDAWVTPDGALLGTDGTPLPHDAQWLARPAQPVSLADWLLPADNGTVAPEVLRRLLEGVACGLEDPPAVETWLSPDGRFRLGTLAGAWTKPGAEFIGYAARAAARARRLHDIALRLDELAADARALEQSFTQLADARRQAAREWERAPGDDALRGAHAHAAACAREYDAARLRLDQAERRWHEAAQAWEQAQHALARDAEDLTLPATREALSSITLALQTFNDAAHALAAATRELRDAMAELAQQRAREQEAADAAQNAADHAAERLALAEEAQIHWQTLQESIGAEVDDVRRRLADARTAVATGQRQLEQQHQARRLAAENRAQAGQKALSAAATLDERTTARQQAVVHLQGFAATGLLATALPEAELPPLAAPWTIEPALTLARRAEQALSDVKDDDEAWSRVQSQVSQDFTELGRALSALSHQAQAETNDHGFVVRIVYRNRPERPDQLSLQLAAEIAQRRELLTAGEREVLENHLQAEIAAAVQKLLREAERQVDAINTELHKRPTSTGVRFRLQWQTLPEGADGAPVGLEAARRRLLNTGADLWTAEDRRVVGEMLQQRIAAERSRADAEQGGSLQEQLARALDYRRWHRFRVQRWQDGQWRALSGPASSGERALGLTVPLFAAVSSFYSQAGSVHAPRLVLLDEAFAGIDDAARAHCWALVREFDLDFVITSEREWACSAELPGVAIAQLQRREGVDAVHVSRWVWDGRARRREDDPDRRFPPAPPVPPADGDA